MERGKKGGKKNLCAEVLFQQLTRIKLSCVFVDLMKKKDVADLCSL